MAGGSSELVSSTHAVLSNDDLVTEILRRLPVVSFHVFKYVSKRWLTIITNPNFPQPHSPFGLFIPKQNYFEYHFVPLAIRIQPNRSPLPTTFTLDFDSCKTEILQSCNGLLLCRTMDNDRKLYVYNPSIHRFKPIPQCPGIGRLRMAFDPSKSCHYKIVYAGGVRCHRRPLIQIKTYSSETCKRRVCRDPFDIRLFRYFNSGIYWNGAIHWLDGKYNTSHFKLDVEHLLLTCKQTPATLDGDEEHCDQKLFVSGGFLLFLCVDSQQMNIYEMRGTRWSAKYVIKLVEVVMLLPKSWRKALRICLSHVRGVVIGKKEEDSFLVMEIYGTIVKYKISLKTLCMLCDLEPVHSPVRFQFIASVAGV